MKNKGFTLVELLAVIVILGVLLTIGTISITAIINNSRKQTFVDSAKNFIAATRQIAADNPGRFYPQDLGSSNIVYVKDLPVTGGGSAMSPYNCEYDYDKSFVRIENTKAGYDFYISLIDKEGHAITEKDGDTYKDVKENELDVSKIIQDSGVTYVLTSYGIIDLAITPATKACVKLGDINGDKQLNNDDYSLCMRIANGSYQVNEAEYYVLTNKGINSDYYAICEWIKNKNAAKHYDGSYKVEIDHNLKGFNKYSKYSEADC